MVNYENNGRYNNNNYQNKQPNNGGGNFGNDMNYQQYPDNQNDYQDNYNGDGNNNTHNNSGNNNNYQHSNQGHNNQPQQNTNNQRNNYQERGPKIKKTFFTTKSLLALECFPENDQTILFTILGQGQTPDKKYDPTSTINIKMNLEEIACMIEGIEIHRLGGPDNFLQHVQRIHPPKQGAQPTQGLNFYHKGTKYQTSIQMNLTNYGGLILFVNRTEIQSNERKGLSFSILPSIEYSFELTLRSFFQTILSTYRQSEQWQSNNNNQ